MTSPVIVRITEGLQRAIGEDCGIGARLKLKFDQNGVILIDASRRPNRISNEDRAADCTLSMSLDTFQKVVGGEMSGPQAFLQGKVKVAGDMSVALKVAPLLRKR
ncbi:MAG: SCP2 sterol-binding domain-containing protein [Alphaproteobacteria bacterium]